MLTIALGKPEHGGRVRGQGTHVRQSVYFDLPRQKKAKTMDEKIREGVQKCMAEETSRIIRERDAFWAAEMQKLKAELLTNPVQHQASPNAASHQASCSQSKDGVVGVKILDTPESGAKILSVEEDGVVHKVKNIENLVVDLQAVFQRDSKVVGEDDNGRHADKKNTTLEVKVDASGCSVCQLAVGSLSNIVACAKIDEVPVLEGLEQTIHGVKLAEENARVSITQVIQGDAKIPFPIGDEIVTVQQAMGTFITWPRDLIVLGNNSTTRFLSAPKVRRGCIVNHV